MTTTVVKVNGLSPEEWTSDDRNRYVGRMVKLRTGKFASEIWPNSGLGNPYIFTKFDTQGQKRQKLFRYVFELKHRIETEPLIAETFADIQGKILGCWCCDWDGRSEMPLCHACCLARISDILHAGYSVGVHEQLTFSILRNEDDIRLIQEQRADKIVIFRRGNR